jgi:hypothetical protein
MEEGGASYTLVPHDWALAMHLISAHCDSMAIERTPAENKDQHEHEHDGPGTIRNHPRNWLGWDENEIERTLEECEEDL